MSGVPAGGPDPDVLRRRALEVLDANWSEELRSTLPHPVVYPHRWLWDSCFHVVAYAALGHPRAQVEMASVLGSALPTVAGRGFLPHMVYGDPERTAGVWRGPLRRMSSFTQPPVFVHALAQLRRAGSTGEPWMEQAADDALGWLWRCRMRHGLLVVTHPWETGADISPRFDGWYLHPVDPDDRWVRYDELVACVCFDESGAAVDNDRGTVAPAAFNAIAVDAARTLAGLTGDAAWRERADRLAAELDHQLWDEGEGLWRDRPARDDDDASAVPTLDGVIGALGTSSAERAERALAQTVGDGRFAAPFGPRYLPAGHPAYDADAYWRGPAWPQLGYLLVLAARRHGLDGIARRLAEHTVAGVAASGFAEYWNPETGEGRGAVPQSWATLAVALLGDG